MDHAGGAGCARGRALDGARGLAVSPDGKHVYVASAGAGGVAVFDRDGETGALRQLRGTAGCLTHDGRRGSCNRVRAVRSAQAVAVSPDGRHVYVAGSELAVFVRSPFTGALKQLSGRAGCVGFVSSGCAAARGLFPGSLGDLAISPDGRSVYVVSHRVRRNVDGEAFDEGSIALFARNRRTGALTQLPGGAGCLADKDVGGCTVGSLLANLTAVVVAADGRNVYVASEQTSEDEPAPDSVLALARATGGGLSFVGCVSRTPHRGCVANETVFGPTDVAVSPDGKTIYVTSLLTASVAAFARSDRGGLRSAGPGSCVGAAFLPGCADPGGLAGPTSVAVSRDGRHAYVTWSGGQGTSAVGAFALEGDGRLALLPGKSGCVGQPALSETCAVGRGLDGAHAVAVSPDGKNVYVAATGGSAVAVFARG